MPSSSPRTEAGRPFPRSARLITAREFRRVYSRGQRARGRAFVLVAHRRRHPGHRLGLSVSREHGGAVRRNKIKRLLREAFRLERPNLAGSFDMILIPQKRDGHYQLDQLRCELVALVRRIESGRGRGRSRQ